VSIETLIFLLAVGLFVYANFVRPLLERRRRRPAPAPVRSRPGAGDEAAAAPVAFDADDWGRGPAPVEAQAEAPRRPRPTAAPHERLGAPRPRTSGRVSLPSPAELRRLGPRDLRGVVVLTTVLGPCRALEDADRDPPRRL
jgi:hypothetical protein